MYTSHLTLARIYGHHVVSKYPTPNFNILNFVSFSTSTTHSGLSRKLQHNYSRTTTVMPCLFQQNCKSLECTSPLTSHLVWPQSKYSYKSYLNEHLNPLKTCTLNYLCPCPTCYPFNTNRSHISNNVSILI